MWEYRETTELCHYGILGQKWGKRNGPPYPLNSSAKSAEEKRKAAEKRKKAKIRAEKQAERDEARKARRSAKAEARQEKALQKREKQTLSRKQKKMVAIGATAVGAALLLSRKNRKKDAAAYKKALNGLDLGSLNDTDLKSKIERLKMEEEVVKLSMDRGVAKKGASVLQAVFKESGPNISKQVIEKVGVAVLTGGALYLAKSIASKSFNGKELGEALFYGGPKKK